MVFKRWMMSATALVLALIVCFPLYGLSITGTSVADVPNGHNGADPFAGGARVVHTVNTGTETTLKDFHICVGESDVSQNPPLRKVRGDISNDNYRETPGTTPTNWRFRGVQAGESVTVGGIKTSQWYLTWTRSPSAEAPTTSINFSYDYKGSNAVEQRNQTGIFTTDGNLTTSDGVISRANAVTVSMASARSETEDIGGSSPAIFWLVITLILAIVFYFVFRWIFGLIRSPQRPPSPSGNDRH